MKRFSHLDADSLETAAAALSEHGKKARLIAGGTDLLGEMQDAILPDYPEVIVNLKSIPGLDYLREEDGKLHIGALTRLEDIANSELVQQKYPLLAEASCRTASPHIREMGTIGGNICQLNRCWYFRKADNRFDCIRKGGSLCYALTGENRYHSIFGGIQACFAVNPSDTAPALVALGAKIVTTKRTIEAEQFWDFAVPGSTVLEAGELVKEIQVPSPADGVKSAFLKFAVRTSIDFPIVNCAAAIGGGDARICLNAVYNKPYRVTAAEDAIKGKAIDVSSAEAAADEAVKAAVPLPYNAWKIKVARAQVKRTILLCEPGGSFLEFKKVYECV